MPGSAGTAVQSQPPIAAHHSCQEVLNFDDKVEKGYSIGDPTKFNHEVPALSEKVSKNISCSLEYACRHWGLHLCSGLLSSDLWQLLKDFCLKYLVNWIEVCSLLGCLKNAVQMLVSVQEYLKVCMIQTSGIGKADK